MQAILMLLVLMVGASPVCAQSKASEKEWNAVVDGAKKEGRVVVAGSPDPVMRNEIIPKFTARYGIAVEFIAGRSSEITARVQTERGSGVHSVDLFLAGPDTTATTLYGEKMIDPLRPLLVMPEVADGSKWKTGKIWFPDPEERYVVRPFSSVATLLFINTDHVRAEELRSAKDLLNPKWRGKISTEDPTTTCSAQIRRRDFSTTSAKISSKNSTSTRKRCERASAGKCPTGWRVERSPFV
jgi:iron(III) transport system substrate-binding protein